MIKTLCQLLLAFVGTDPASGLDGRSLASKQIAEFVHELQNVYCYYEYSEEPTPEFVDLAVAESKKSASEIRRQFGNNSKITFVETRGQHYLLAILKDVDDTSTVRVEDRYSFDGRDTWKWRKVVLKDGTDTTSVERGGDHGKILGTGVVTRKFLPFALLRGGISILQQVLENPATEILPDEVVEGEPCTVLRLVEVAGDTARRTTLWLGVNKRYVLEQLREEYRKGGGSNWLVFDEIITRKTGSTRVASAEGQKSFAMWYPTELVKTTYNKEGICTFKGAIVVRDLRVNSNLDPKDLKPRIEDGTNFRDASTGKASVFGAGPSPRIKAMVKRRVEESRAQLEGLEGADLTGGRSPPRSWVDALSWGAVILGFAGAIAAACVHAMSREKR